MKKITFVPDFPFAASAFLAGYMMVFALFYQHVMGFEPCARCIEIRIIVALLFIVSTVATFVNKLWLRRFTIAAIFLGYGAIFQRNWELFKYDLGLNDTSSTACSFDPGIAGALGLDRVLPSFFEVRALCEGTPSIFFNSMPMSSALAIISIICPLIIFHIYRTVRVK